MARWLAQRYFILSLNGCFVPGLSSALSAIAHRVKVEEEFELGGEKQWPDLSYLKTEFSIRFQVWKHSWCSKTYTALLVLALGMELYLALAIPILITTAWLYTAQMTRSSLPNLHNKRICLLVAHPDDEAMFFSPTVIALTAPEACNHVKILCLSSGPSILSSVVAIAILICSLYRRCGRPGRDTQRRARRLCDNPWPPIRLRCSRH